MRSGLLMAAAKKRGGVAAYALWSAEFSNAVTITNGGKTVAMNGQGANFIGKAGTAKNAGKWYFELTQDSGGVASPFGLWT